MLTKEKWNAMGIDEKYGLMKLARIPASRVAFCYEGWSERLWEALNMESRCKAEKGGGPMETLEQRERQLREKLERLGHSKFPVIQKHAGKCLQLLARVQDERR